MSATSAVLAGQPSIAVSPAPTVTYEFKVVAEPEASVSFGEVLRSTWRQSLSYIAIAVVAAQFLVLPLTQQRAQVVAAQELQERFTIAAGAIGHSDLSPLPSQPLAMGTPVASLTIPSIGVEQVVVAGAGAQQTRIGPGHASGTAGIGERGVSVIAGHRVAAGAPFANINKLQVGDVVSTTTVAGEMTYKVTRVGGAIPDSATTATDRSILVLASSAPAGLAASDLVVVAESVKPAYPSTPQNAMAATGLRGGDMGSMLPLLVLTAVLLSFITLARFWYRARLMDRVVVWTVSAPVVALLGFLLAGTVSSVLPPTL